MGDFVAGVRTTGLPAPAPRAVPVPGPGDAARVGRDFEAMLLGETFEQMFRGVPTGGPFGGGHAESTWRSFMLHEYAKAVAESGTTGIGRSVERMIGEYEWTTRSANGKDDGR